MKAVVSIKWAARKMAASQNVLQSRMHERGLRSYRLGRKRDHIEG